MPVIPLPRAACIRCFTCRLAGSIATASMSLRDFCGLAHKSLVTFWYLLTACSAAMRSGSLAGVEVWAELGVRSGSTVSLGSGSLPQPARTSAAAAQTAHVRVFTRCFSRCRWSGRGLQSNTFRPAPHLERWEPGSRGDRQRRRPRPGPRAAQQAHHSGSSSAARATARPTSPRVACCGTCRADWWAGTSHAPVSPQIACG